MQFNQQDQDALYQIWMSQKAKLRITQMEFAKQLGLTQLEFSQRIRGPKPLDMGFILNFCQHLGLEPSQVIPSLKPEHHLTGDSVRLKTRLMVDGQIERAYIEDNQVVVEYLHRVQDGK
jgi:transcriptional regulator with XRE-family HTH domain